jgi:hypothetical protein
MVVNIVDLEWVLYKSNYTDGIMIKNILIKSCNKRESGEFSWS